MAFPFNEKNIVKSKSFKPEVIVELSKVSKHRIHDLLPHINTKNPVEMEIIESWSEDFKSRKIPFAVTKQGYIYTLWKKKFAEYHRMR